MKKLTKKTRKLKLTRRTLRRLEMESLNLIAGGPGPPMPTNDCGGGGSDDATAASCIVC